MQDLLHSFLSLPLVHVLFFENKFALVSTGNCTFLIRRMLDQGLIKTKEGWHFFTLACGATSVSIWREKNIPVI